MSLNFEINHKACDFRKVHICKSSTFSSDYQDFTYQKLFPVGYFCRLSSNVENHKIYGNLSNSDNVGFQSLLAVGDLFFNSKLDFVGSAHCIFRNV